MTVAWTGSKYTAPFGPYFAAVAGVGGGSAWAATGAQNPFDPGNGIGRNCRTFTRDAEIKVVDLLR